MSDSERRKISVSTTKRKSGKGKPASKDGRFECVSLHDNQQNSSRYRVKECLFSQISNSKFPIGLGITPSL